MGDALAGVAMLGTELAGVPQLSRGRGAGALYVSSVPSDSAVGFYLARGFRPTEPLPGPFEKEPEDIHMLLTLT